MTILDELIQVIEPIVGTEYEESMSYNRDNSNVSYHRKYDGLKIHLDTCDDKFLKLTSDDEEGIQIWTRVRTIPDIVRGNRGFSACYISPENLKKWLDTVDTKIKEESKVATFRIESQGHGISYDYKFTFNFTQEDGITPDQFYKVINSVQESGLLQTIIK